MSEKRPVLVTGVSGLIGRRVVECPHGVNRVTRSVYRSLPLCPD